MGEPTRLETSMINVPGLPCITYLANSASTARCTQSTLVPWRVKRCGVRALKHWLTGSETVMCKYDKQQDTVLWYWALLTLPLRDVIYNIVTSSRVFKIQYNYALVCNDLLSTSTPLLPCPELLT